MLGRVLVVCTLILICGTLYTWRFNDVPNHQHATIIDGPAVKAEKARNHHTPRKDETPRDHPQTPRLEHNPFTGRAISDGRTYSVALIDANKNNIPSDTELFVQGTLLTAQWTQDNACTWFLIRGRPNVQHGDNPASYCRFSILLTEKREDGQDMWPAASLVCEVTPQEMREVTHLYHYGDAVQAHGFYAASLDFGVVPGLGGHFGVPALEGCTFADPTENVVR